MRTLEHFCNPFGKGVVLMNSLCGELRVKFIVVKPAHPDKSPRLDTDVHIFLILFQNLIGAILFVVGDIPVITEAPAVTS